VPALCEVSAAAELSAGIRSVDHISQPEIPAPPRATDYVDFWRAASRGSQSVVDILLMLSYK